MKSTFYSYSFGCRVNQAEKEALDRELSGLGYQWNAEDPEVYIINSCSVTHKAEREARQLIYQVKKKYPDTKIVVTGCAATNWIKNKIDVPEVDYLVDNQNKQYVASLIAKNTKLTPHNTQPVTDKYINSGRIIFKIQDGCQRFCSFCIVPYLRGLPKSATINELVEKISLLSPDIKEVILTAINTEAFGYDTKETFVNLLREILDKTKISRISFGSIHPWSLQEDFFTFYRSVADAERLVNFFHIPLQSGSNNMLRLMKRGYTREEILQKLHTLNSIKPHTFIGTDIIVGYLEETDKDFEDTYEFLKNSPISKFHVFRFSKRQQTAAYYLAKRLNEPDPQTKAKRAKALIDLGKKKYETFLQTHVGYTFPALFLEKREGEWQHALLSNQIPVLVKTDANKTGNIIPVKVEKHTKGNLFGVLT